MKNSSQANQRIQMRHKMLLKPITSSLASARRHEAPATLPCSVLPKRHYGGLANSRASSSKDLRLRHPTTHNFNPNAAFKDKLVMKETVGSLAVALGDDGESDTLDRASRQSNFLAPPCKKTTRTMSSDLERAAQKSTREANEDKLVVTKETEIDVDGFEVVEPTSVVVSKKKFETQQQMNQTRDRRIEQTSQEGSQRQLQGRRSRSARRSRGAPSMDISQHHQPMLTEEAVNLEEPRILEEMKRRRESNTSSTCPPEPIDQSRLPTPHDLAQKSNSNLSSPGVASGAVKQRKRLEMQALQQQMEQKYVKQHKDEKNIVLHPHTPPSDGAVELGAVKAQHRSGAEKGTMVNSLESSGLIHNTVLDDEKSSTQEHIKDVLNKRINFSKQSAGLRGTHTRQRSWLSSLLKDMNGQDRENSLGASLKTATMKSNQSNSPSPVKTSTNGKSNSKAESTINTVSPSKLVQSSRERMRQLDQDLHRRAMSLLDNKQFAAPTKFSTESPPKYIHKRNASAKMSLDKTDKRSARKNNGSNSSLLNDVSPPKAYKLPEEPQHDYLQTETVSPHIRLNLHPTEPADNTDDSVSPVKSPRHVTTPERERPQTSPDSPPQMNQKTPKSRLEQQGDSVEATITTVSLRQQKDQTNNFKLNTVQVPQLKLGEKKSSVGKLLAKHAEGIDTIVEYAPDFEQTQTLNQVDLIRSPKEQENLLKLEDMNSQQMKPTMSQLMVPIHKMPRPAKKPNQHQSSRSHYPSFTTNSKPAEASRTMQSARGSHASTTSLRPTSGARYGLTGQKSSFDLPLKQMTGKLREQRSVFGENSKKYSVATSRSRLAAGSGALTSQRQNSAMSARGYGTKRKVIVSAYDNRSDAGSQRPQSQASHSHLQYLRNNRAFQPSQRHGRTGSVSQRDHGSNDVSMNSSVMPELRLGDTHMTESGADVIPIESTVTPQANSRPQITEAEQRRLATVGNMGSGHKTSDDYSSQLNSIQMPKTATPDDEAGSSSRIPTNNISRYSQQTMETKPAQTLEDLQKHYLTRVEFFQDFYKSVKTYSNFNSDQGYQGFLQRKAEKEQQRKEAQERVLSGVGSSTSVVADEKSTGDYETFMPTEPPMLVSKNKDALSATRLSQGALTSTSVAKSNRSLNISRLQKPTGAHTRSKTSLIGAGSDKQALMTTRQRLPAPSLTSKLQKPSAMLPSNFNAPQLQTIKPGQRSNVSQKSSTVSGSDAHRRLKSAAQLPTTIAKSSSMSTIEVPSNSTTSSVAKAAPATPPVLTLADAAAVITSSKLIDKEDVTELLRKLHFLSNADELIQPSEETVEAEKFIANVTQQNLSKSINKELVKHQLTNLLTNMTVDRNYPIMQRNRRAYVFKMQSRAKVNEVAKKYETTTKFQPVLESQRGPRKVFEEKKAVAPLKPTQTVKQNRDTKRTSINKSRVERNQRTSFVGTSHFPTASSFRSSARKTPEKPALPPSQVASNHKTPLFGAAQTQRPTNMTVPSSVGIKSVSVANKEKIAPKSSVEDIDTKMLSPQIESDDINLKKLTDRPGVKPFLNDSPVDTKMSETRVAPLLPQIDRTSPLRTVEKNESQTRSNNQGAPNAFELTQNHNVEMEIEQQIQSLHTSQMRSEDKHEQHTAHDGLGKVKMYEDLAEEDDGRGRVSMPEGDSPTKSVALSAYLPDYISYPEKIHCQQKLAGDVETPLAPSTARPALGHTQQQVIVSSKPYQVTDQQSQEMEQDAYFADHMMAPPKMHEKVGSAALIQQPQRHNRQQLRTERSMSDDSNEMNMYNKTVSMSSGPNGAVINDAQNARKYATADGGVEGTKGTDTADEADLASDEEQEEDQPILILDIKLVKDQPQKIIVYEDDNPEEIVRKFCEQNQIDEMKRKRLLSVIKAQIEEYYAEQSVSQSVDNKTASSARQERQDTVEDMRDDALTQIDERVGEDESHTSSRVSKG